jgi:hypothetical protein
MNNPITTDRLPNLAVVYRIWQELDDAELLEDRREYDEEMLRKAHPILTKPMASYLRELIQLPFNPDYRNLYSMTPNNDQEPDAQLRMSCVSETIGECIHNSYEGWSDGEKVIIELFLMDLGIATNLAFKSYKERDGK